ncbi:hypothetical protein [Fodinicola acaciae]|uniref:hypothetical protein n=1 Tax=Fodinicola acaciae TaxID=2681555 RepID=UPI0013D68311|nr:hypothetical protein [Fodinicola acaciae]
MVSTTQRVGAKQAPRRSAVQRNEYARRAAKEIQGQLNLIQDAGDALAAVEAARNQFNKAKDAYTRKYESATKGVSTTVLRQSGLPTPDDLALETQVPATEYGKPAPNINHVAVTQS